MAQSMANTPNIYSWAQDPLQWLVGQLDNTAMRVGNSLGFGGSIFGTFAGAASAVYGADPYAAADNEVAAAQPSVTPYEHSMADLGTLTPQSFHSGQMASNDIYRS